MLKECFFFPHRYIYLECPNPVYSLVLKTKNRIQLSVPRIEHVFLEMYNERNNVKSARAWGSRVMVESTQNKI